MTTRHFGTFNAPPNLRSSYTAIDVQPHDDVRDAMQMMQRADSHNAMAMQRWRWQRQIARMQKAVDKLRNV